MNVLEALTAKRTRLLADATAVEQAIKSLTSVFKNGHANGSGNGVAARTKRKPRGPLTEQQRANISAGLRASHARRSAQPKQEVSQ